MKLFSQNLIITIICFVLYEYLSRYISVFTENINNIIGLYYFSSLIANVIVAFPIIVGNTLLTDGKNYWQRLSIKGNIIEALIVGVLLCLSLSILFTFYYPAFLQFLYQESSRLFIAIFFIEVCTRVFFFADLGTICNGGYCVSPYYMQLSL
ncbi:hypothetical protein [Capnocytophaga sp. HP1101]